METPVGFIISWRVPAEVPLTHLRAGLAAAGLDPDMAPDLKPASLVSRSAAYVAKVTSGHGARRLARPVSPLARQITLEQPAGDTLDYTREAAIGYDDTTGKLTCDEPVIAATLDETAARIHETRTAHDVCRLVQRVVESAGSDLIPVREQGGAYFIPAGHGVIDQVQTVLQAVGGDLQRFACTIGHGSDESVATVITDYMLKQIGDLQASVDELNEKGIRADVKSRRLTHVASLRERLGAYATLIQAQGTTLTAALDKAEASLLAKLGPEPTPEPAPAAEPEPVPVAA